MPSKRITTQEALTRIESLRIRAQVYGSLGMTEKLEDVAVCIELLKELVIRPEATKKAAPTALPAVDATHNVRWRTD